MLIQLQRGGDSEARIEELESQLSQRDKDLEEERERASNMTSDLEKQMKNAKELNKSLQAEIDRMRADREADDWREKYENLEQDFNEFRQSKDGLEQELHEHRQHRDALEQEYFEYRQSTDDVRHQTAESMQELRALTEHVSGRREGEEALAKKNAELREELENLKSRHAKTRAHLRSLRASSTGLFIQQPTAAQFIREGSVLDSQGAIHDVSVTRFQLSVDELLQLAREGAPSDVLGHMRQLVACVRGITNDVSKANPRGSEDFMKRRKKLEARVASTTNNLITVCKNHAVANGLAPVALVDAAASHLTAGVVDYIKIMKVKPSYEGELEDRDDFT